MRKVSGKQFEPILLVQLFFDSLKCNTDDNQGCRDMIADKYMFYLSFENSICKDYITEKFFDPLQTNIVPVVFGRANHSEISPPHSFIDASRSETPEALANLLTKIANNEALYANYFWWKDYYSVGGFSPQDRAQAPCTVCQMLHQEEGRRWRCIRI